MTLPAAVSGASYNAANRLSNWGGASLTYDAKGNLTSDGSLTYTWDSRSRLTALTGGTTASFSYDSLNRRSSKTVGGTATAFAYDGLNVVQERTGGSSTASLLTGLGLDETFSRTDTVVGTRSFVTDALGSTLALTDGTGLVKTSYAYEPYGAATASGEAGGNATQYTGRENDGTGLYYYWARYYHTAFGRFVAEAPIGLAGGDNLYAYVGGIPLRYADPTGKCPMCLALIPPVLEAAGISLADIGIGSAIGGGLVALDRWLNPSAQASAFPPGVWPGDMGSAEWDRRNGVGARDGKGRFHGIK
nr:RHS repeat-associated core domain-containing protein [Cupriavidus basilensis]